MKKILLIEDNMEVRENTAEILELAQYIVSTASNGKTGVELAQKEKPDLIICDVMMPILDGYGVLHMLSKNSDTAGIPFIFLTAKAERSDFRKGMEMGADDYVTKPFDDIELLNAVESRLKKSVLLGAQYAKSLEGFNEFLSEVKSLEDLTKLSSDRKIRQYQKKETIFWEGSNPNGLFFIIKGKVKTFRTNEEGKELIVNLLGEGDFIGYQALLEESEYKESASALEATEMCLVSKEDFFSLIYKNSDVSRKFIQMLSDNLAEKEARLLNLAYHSVRKRIAEALVALQIKYQNNDQTGNFAMSLSREDLANMVGTSTESAIRTLSDFKEEKLIGINGGTITVLNFEKLQRMKN
jgi:CRP-like cAMP-binding protein/ActR/RegA family two-component response regulator